MPMFWEILIFSLIRGVGTFHITRATVDFRLKNPFQVFQGFNWPNNPFSSRKILEFQNTWKSTHPTACIIAKDESYLLKMYRKLKVMKNTFNFVMEANFFSHTINWWVKQNLFSMCHIKNIYYTFQYDFCDILKLYSIYIHSCNSFQTVFL